MKECGSVGEREAQRPALKGVGREAAGCSGDEVKMEAGGEGALGGEGRGDSAGVQRQVLCHRVHLQGKSQPSPAPSV